MLTPTGQEFAFLSSIVTVDNQLICEFDTEETLTFFDGNVAGLVAQI